MKTLGSYTQPPRVIEQRRPAVVLAYRGPSATVRLHDNTTYAMPAAPLRAIGAAEGQRVLMIVTYTGPRLTNVRFELFTDARPAMEHRGTPRMYARQGRAVVRRPV